MNQTKATISNILKILMLKKNIKTTQLARTTKVPQQTLQRIVTGTTPNPHISSLKPIADHFDITIEQLKGEQQLPKELLLTAGFEDILVKKAINVPLLTWEQLKDLNKINKQRNGVGIETFENIITISANFDEKCFGLIMNDSSMDPYFPKDSILVINPEKEIKDRCFALIKLNKEKIFIFRQILLDGQHEYLKPLNPDLTNFQMRLLNKEDKIIGVLVEARRVYDNA